MKRTMLSVKGIDKELSVSVQLIRRACWRGDILAYRISKMLRFDLERFQRISQTQGLSRIVRSCGARSAAPAADAHSSIAPVR